MSFPAGGEGEAIMDDAQYWAQDSFARADQRVQRQFDAAIQSGSRAIQAAFLLNGGACIALLFFLASTYNTDVVAGEYSRLMEAVAASQDKARLMGAIVTILTGFAWGALLAVLALALGYFVNGFYSMAEKLKKRGLEAPYVRDTPDSTRCKWAGHVLGVLTMLAGFSSLGLFVHGVTKIDRLF